MKSFLFLSLFSLLLAGLDACSCRRHSDDPQPAPPEYYTQTITVVDSFPPDSGAVQVNRYTIITSHLHFDSTTQFSIASAPNEYPAMQIWFENKPSPGTYSLDPSRFFPRFVYYEEHGNINHNYLALKDSITVIDSSGVTNVRFSNLPFFAGNNGAIDVNHTRPVYWISGEISGF